MEEKKKFEDSYPEKDFAKTIYSFKAQEIAKLAPWDADVQKGRIGETVIASIIRNECFKRIGVKQSIDIGIKYDILDEKFILFVPRVWCSSCGNRKAEYSVGNTVYCKACLDILREKTVSQTEQGQETKKGPNNATEKKKIQQDK
jgi:hypothetical protein